jgi:hypothetical protein
MITRVISIGGLIAGLAGCSADAGANPALRCGTQDDCPAGQLCHASFCIADGTPDQAAESIGDGEDNPPVDAESDAGAAGPAQPGDDQGGDGEDGNDPGDDEAQGEPSCKGGLCCVAGLTPCEGLCLELLSGVGCKSDELACDGKCVNPEKDKHHCGACGKDCGSAKCKDGMCEEDP